MRDARLNRRAVLRAALRGSGVLLGSALLGACRREASEAAAPHAAGAAGSLAPPDAHGVRLPPGYRARIVAQASLPPHPGARYAWHGSPDGGATFATGDGGWVYVSNSELPAGRGGVGALRFDAAGEVVDAYPICSGTSLNCAGGPTPWGTWLSCEEHPRGLVWECDPRGGAPARPLPALGRFTHEAVAVDLPNRHVYLTEDTPRGRIYRFTGAPTAGGRLDLSAGLLEAAQVEGGSEGAVRWLPVPDPEAATVPTAAQVPASTPFAGPEGMCIDGATVYFTTKFDTRVWAYDTRAETLRILYDDDAFAEPPLRGVDNVVVSPAGHVLVAEDGGDMQLVAITATGLVYPVLQVVGHHDSELAGPAFDPSGTRLYLSSQRGPGGSPAAGITFEISGPFARG